MNHTVQNPLYVDFNFAPEGKAVQSLVGSDIGIYGFNNGNALRIYFASFFTVYLFNHCFGKIGLFSSETVRSFIRFKVNDYYCGSINNCET
jgi:hypothetical protein